MSQVYSQELLKVKLKPGFLKNVIKEYISHDNKTSVAIAFAFALFLLLFKFSKRLENLIFNFGIDT